MKLLKRTTVADWKDHLGNTSMAFPGIAVTPSGRIIVTWRSAPQKTSLEGQHILCSFSDDGGNSWSVPVNVFSPPEINGTPGTLRCGYPSYCNGKLYMVICWVDNSIPGRPFFKESNQGLLDCKIFITRSVDDGDSWSTLQYAGTEPFENLSTPITGPMMTFRDGESMVQFELNKPYDSDEVWRHLSVLQFSKDDGKTFYRHSIPAADPENNIFYWDQRPMILSDDTLVDFFWTWDNASNTYFNIQVSLSKDRGMSWTGALDTGLPGQPGQPVEFADGSLMLPLVDRTGDPQIVARLSTDQGKSFSPEVLCISRPVDSSQNYAEKDLAGAWEEMGKFSVGLPAGTASGKNTAYVVWYAGSETDHTNIEFAEIGRE